MFYVGLDIQSERISLCALSDPGQVVRRAQVRALQEMMRRRWQAWLWRAQYAATSPQTERRRRERAAEAALTAT
jgi:hypothetical protein